MTEHERRIEFHGPFRSLYHIGWEMTGVVQIAVRVKFKDRSVPTEKEINSKKCEIEDVIKEEMEKAVKEGFVR